MSSPSKNKAQKYKKLIIVATVLHCMTMEKSHYDKEINRLVSEADQLTQKYILDLDTAKFLDNEASKLEQIIDSVGSTREQIEEAVAKLNILYKRIEREMKEAITDDVKADKIERELKFLKSQRT